MTRRFYSTVRLALSAILFLLNQIGAQATVTADSQLSFDNFSLSLSDFGDVTFTWNPSSTDAQAGPSSQHNSGASSTADATDAFSFAHGEATAIALPDVSGSVHAHAEVPGQTTASDTAAGRGSVSGSFIIENPPAFGPKGKPPGLVPVTVTFSVDINRSLLVSSDIDGVLASAETFFGIKVDGVPLLLDQHSLSIGPSDSGNQTFSGTLSQSLLLQYDTPYQIWLGAEADVSVSNLSTVPEPGAGGLLVGAGLVLAVILNSLTHSAPQPRAR